MPRSPPPRRIVAGPAPAAVCWPAPPPRAVHRLCAENERPCRVMGPEDVRFPVAYYGGTAYFLAPTDRYTGSYFGGPSDVSLTGVRHGPEPLHHVLTIDYRVVPALEEAYLFQLPLFYGLRYDGCELTYRASSDDCRITKLSPRKSSANWPYRDYPPYLP